MGPSKRSNKMAGNTVCVAEDYCTADGNGEKDPGRQRRQKRGQQLAFCTGLVAVGGLVCTQFCIPICLAELKKRREPSRRNDNDEGPSNGEDWERELMNAPLVDSDVEDIANNNASILKVDFHSKTEAFKKSVCRFYICCN